MNTKTRGIVIKRRHKVTTMNKKGEPVEEMRSDYFICRINAEIPPSHKNFQSL
jgi:hypothetical protein